jgi:competence protein ComEA
VPSFTLSRRRALVVVGSALVVLVAAAHFLLAPAPASTPGAVPPIGAVSTGVATAPRVVVHVVGAVRRPGVYRLEQGDRVGDAVARAGGLARRADAAAVNLAAPLADGQQVVVPGRGRGAMSVGVGSSAAASGPVHLNTASVEELDELPGVGPVTAQKIIDFREQHGPFASADELDAVPGIGPARLDDLRKLVAP